MARKNITLSAEEKLIQLARAKAFQEHKSLNAIFQEWLKLYVGNDHAVSNYRNLMKQLKHVKAGKHSTRDELNER